MLKACPLTFISKFFLVCFCRSKLEGTFINWSTSEWNLTNMETTIKDHDQICKTQSATVMFPGLRDFERSKHLCKQFHGSVVVIKNKIHSDYLNNLWWKVVGGKVSPYGSILAFSESI